MTVPNYDMKNSLNCLLLENVLLNDENVDMLVRLQGIDELARIMMEQPVKSELEDESQWQYTPQFVN